MIFSCIFFLLPKQAFPWFIKKLAVSWVIKLHVSHCSDLCLSSQVSGYACMCMYYVSKEYLMCCFLPWEILQTSLCNKENMSPTTPTTEINMWTVLCAKNILCRVVSMLIYQPLAKEIWQWLILPPHKTLTYSFRKCIMYKLSKHYKILCIKDYK